MLNKTLSELESFGDVAAEDDAVLEYFLSTDAVERIKSGRVLLVLGRKGTGKTALVRYFSESDQSASSRPLNLRGYPWSLHARRIDHGASEIEAYVSSWRFFIAVELASLLLSSSARSSHKVEELWKFLDENYGGVNPELGKILQPKRLSVSRLNLNPSILGNSLGSIELDRDGPDYNFGPELNAISTAIMKTIYNAADHLGIKNLSLHFDELDQGLDKLTDDRRRMLIGLVLAAREIRREAAAEGSVVINPVVYLRSDLWEEMSFSDKNKINQTLALHLNWASDDLQRLVDERLRAKLGDHACWESVSEPQLMRGSQSKWSHVLARTFHRPRDIIQFLNISLAEAKRRLDFNDVIINRDIVNSRDSYSSYLKKELDDEVGPHWEQWSEALQTLSTISTITFEKAQFINEYSRRRSDSNAVDAVSALELLHRFSVIGYETRSGYGGSSWSFRYSDPEAGWDNSANRFKVHLGLKEYAKLRETRSASN